MLEDLSRIRYVDRQKDKILVHEGAKYVCLMKLFPMCEFDDIPDEEDYRRFHMRFYIPREYFNDARKKIDRIIIMTNGLNEFDKYLLYDQLGSDFASLGLAAVLLPLPNHLNRHPRYRLRNPNDQKIKVLPSDALMENPLLLHDGYLQCKRELAQLRGHINRKRFEGTSDVPCKDNNHDGPCSFYSHFFADEVRVSYLGYSLGGDTVLCDFLNSEKSLNACFLLNPAINLPGVAGNMMVGRATWEEYVPNLLSAMRNYLEKDRMFEEVVIGQYKHESTKLLKEHGQRLLFILGGKDTFTKYTNAQTIMPENWGSGMFIIPGIDHLVAGSEEWKKWRMLAVKLILDFEENAARRVITEKKFDEIRKGIKSDISEKEQRERGEDLSRAALLLTGLRIDQRKAEKDKLKECRKLPLEALRLGEMLYIKDQIDFDELWDALEEQRRCALRDASDEQRMSRMKIGDIFVDVFRLATRKQVEELVAIQRRPKDEA
jgi:hypothetical protein